MSRQFEIRGTFPVKDAVPSADIFQVSREAQKTWSLDKYSFKIEPGVTALRAAHFCFKASTSAAFAEEIVKTVQVWAQRFADWPKGVLEYTVILDGQSRHCFFGPENRCIESKLSSIERRTEELQEEWADLNFTQLAQASDDCVELVDYVGGAC